MNDNQDSADWLKDNADLLFLLRSPEPPTVQNVIDAHKEAFARCVAVDSNVFTHLIELAGMHAIRARDEHCSYSVIAEHLDATVVAGPSNPDLITSDNIPVEVKVGKFTVTALRQLQRYMEKMGANRGVACGEELAVDLPHNITFVQILFDGRTNRYYVAK